MSLILASSSPRRRAIVSMLGLKFKTRVAQVDETPLPGERPLAAARRVAWAKANAVVAANEVVVGSDTIVVLDDEILGKPANAAEARNMLRRLRGRRHDVISGLAIIADPTALAYVDGVVTAVWMHDYNDAEIDAYVASGEPFDKAGAYAIQSKRFHPVARIEGCYLNVVGLPLCDLVKGLRLVAPTLTWRGSSELEQACRECPLLAAGQATWRVDCC